jgi:hypothetical protein
MSVDAAVAIRRSVPRAKIIVAVCDPIERLWSHYHDGHKNGTGMVEDAHLQLPFDNFVDKLLQSDENRILRMGRFNEHITMWRNVFGRDSVVMWDWSEYKKDASGTMLRLFHSLGLSSYNGTAALGIGGNQSASVETMAQGTRVRLEDYYTSKNILT